MRTGYVIKVSGNSALVVLSDLEIQKEATILKNVQVAVGDTVLIATYGTLLECFVLGVIE